MIIDKNVNIINNYKKHRLTKQREIVLEELRKLCTHPTAHDLYGTVKISVPNISFATVYRNLNSLEKMGYILKLKVKSKDGKSRYDGNIEPHCHLTCQKCGNIIDIFDCENLTIKTGQVTDSGFKICTNHLEIPGLCNKCNT